MTTSYLGVFSVRYALLSKKFSRRVHKIITKSYFICLSVFHAQGTVSSRDKLRLSLFLESPAVVLDCWTLEGLNSAPPGKIVIELYNGDF
jgi:hypothetical protein